jgi:hypothetical protein
MLTLILILALVAAGFVAYKIAKPEVKHEEKVIETPAPIVEVPKPAAPKKKTAKKQVTKK